MKKIMMALGFISLLSCGGPLEETSREDHLVRPEDTATVLRLSESSLTFGALQRETEALPKQCAGLEFSVRLCRIEGTRFRFFYDSPNPEALAIDLALDFGDGHLGIFRAPIDSCGSVNADIGRSSASRMRIATMNTANPNMSCDESTIVDQLVVAMTRFNTAADCRR